VREARANDFLRRRCAQHILPDTNAGNWAKKGHNVTASEVASYRFEGDGAWHALRKRLNGKAPPVIFASTLVNVYGHFFHHCRTLLSDAAVMERLAVSTPRSGPSACRDHLGA
jgi:metal-dependent amidase/aminoacylase/carboxypeptidase family protein